MGACHGREGYADVQPGLQLQRSYSSQKPMAKKKVTVESQVDGLRPAQFILANDSNIHDIYNLGDEVGSGTFGVVVQGIHRVTGVVRAVKTIHKEKVMNIPIFKHEVAIMKQLDHPTIIRLFETFEDSKHFHLAMELCSGGELFHRITGEGPFTEVQAAVVMRQIFQSVYYMHNQKIVHRDLKPENFLFMNSGPLDTFLPPRNPLKLIDFGFACRVGEGMHFTSQVGTPSYMAPEVFQRKYNHMCDLWSCGVIMYVMLTGRMPFTARKEGELMRQQRLGLWSFGKDAHRISESAQALTRSMMQRDPLKRCTALQAMADKWMLQLAPKVTDVQLQDNFVEHLKDFRMQNTLKKATLSIIAGQLAPEKLRALRAIFMGLDRNGDGIVSKDELRASLDHSGWRKTDSDLDQIMCSIDTNSNGMIDWTEFLAAALDHPKYLTRNACWTAFNVFDLDGDGKIQPKELERVLFGSSKRGQTRSRTKTEDLLLEIDTSDDGTINFDQFMNVMLAGSEDEPNRSDSWLNVLARMDEEFAHTPSALGGA